MEELLKHLLVRRSDGTITPASSPVERPIHIDPRHTPRRFHTTLTPKAQASLKQMDGMSIMPIRSTAENTPPPSAQASFPDLGDDYPDLQSIEDFEQENPHFPKPKLIQLKATKVSPECSIRFNNICVIHGIVPDFSYGMFAQNVTSITLQFGDRVVEETGPFASKKQAKEAVCKKALPYLQRLDEQLRSKKRKSSEAQETASSRTSSVVLNSENYIGLLQDYAQIRHMSLPEYTEARTDTTPIQFACTVRIADGPLTPFGSESELYSSKTNAKKAAARDAVLWLRSQSRIPAAPPVKRLKMEDVPSPLNPGQTGLTQLVNDIDVDAADDTSLPQRVHELAASLGLSQPTFESHRSLPPPGVELLPGQVGAFISMAVHFNARDVEAEPRLAGTVVKVENVYGKKKARELCCIELLRVLEEIKHSKRS